jgi:anaerobic selenocysteine-containing dehydrogenase
MSENVLSRQVTRRTFLKATAATAALAAVGDKLFGGPVSTLVQSAAAAAQPANEDVWIPSACYMCFSNCGIKVHRVNGVAVKVEGNPDHPYNQGRNCARSQAGLMKLYNPWRFRAPMRRTNPEKGRDVDPQWEEITWEEALNTVAEKLKKIHDQDPRQFMVMAGWGSRQWGGRCDSDVGIAFGTPNMISGPGGMTCAAAWHNVGYMTNGTSSATGIDFKYANYVLDVGSSVGLNKGDPETARVFWDAKQRGMKFVVVDTRASTETSKADEWVPIRGGTDLAFLLALNNVFLYELQQYDVDFIKQRTNGPYLIRQDNGLYVRSSTEIMEPDPSRKNQELGKPYVWDPVDNKAKVFDDPTIQDYALEGSFTVEGVACQPAFGLYEEDMKDYTPEWQEEITTVPATTVRRIAQEMLEAARIGSTIQVDGVVFPYRPVVVEIGRGAQTHKWGTVIVEAAYLINLLMGCQETPGGSCVGAVQETGPDGVNLPQGTAVYREFKYPPDYALFETYWPTCYKTFWATWDALLDPQKYGIDYSLEALAVVGANPIFGFGSPDLVVEAMKKIPFTFALSYHSDEPTEMADVVLAEPGYLEWLHLTGPALRQPVLDQPLYNTMLPEDILTELAARSGWLADWNNRLNRKLRLKDEYVLEADKQYPQVEILDRQLKSQFGPDHGLDWFRQNGVLDRPGPERENYGYYHNPQTRYQLYFEYMKWAAEELKKDMAAAGAVHPYPDWEQSYEPIPSWKPNPSFEAAAEFDLYESNFRTSLMSMGFSPDNPWTYEAMQLFDRYPMSVWINRQTAESKGLKDGDLVWVESYVQEGWSKIQGEILTSEGVHPESVIIGGQWGRWAVNMNPVAKEGPHHNSLISIKLPYVDHFSGNIDLGSKVKVYKV